MPVDQHTFYLFAKHREELEKWSRIPVPDLHVFMQCLDKAKTFQAASAVGVPCPATYVARTREEMANVAHRASFPLVIKPRIGSGSRGVTYVRDSDLLLREWERIHREQPYPLVQEYIPPGGDALGVSVIFNGKAEPRGVFVHKRLREYPATGGPSTLRESVSRPDAVDSAIRLLRSIHWFGVAMVEFKVDPRDGVPKLMEVNPKLWGSISLAIASGVDFPALLYKLAVDGDVGPVPGYRLGVRARFLLADTLHFLTNPKRFSMQPGFFRFGAKETYGDIWSGDDVWPGLGFWLVLLGHAWRPGVVRHVFGRSRPAVDTFDSLGAGSASMGMPTTGKRKP